MNKLILVTLLFAFIANSAYANPAATLPCTAGTPSTNCATCNTPDNTGCKTCSATFQLDDAKNCQTAISNCTTVDSNNISKCLTCNSGYYVKGADGSCVTCTVASNCATCTEGAPAVCGSCPANNTLNENNICKASLPNCSTISGTDATQCKTCGGAYTVTNGVCCTTTSSCSTCAAASPAVCTACGTNKTLDENNACQTSISNCSLINGTTSTKCKTCATGYGVSADSLSCIQCTPASNCASCAGATPGTCLTCAAGVTLNTTTNTCPAASTNSALLVASSLIVASLFI